MQLGLASASPLKPEVPNRVRGRIGGAVACAAVVAGHALLLSGWLTASAVEASRPVGQPLAVSLIAPAATAPQPQPVAKPEPKPKPQPQPIKPTPKPVEQNVAASAPAAAPPTTTVAAPVAQESEPTVAVRFDADYLNNPAPKYPALSRRLREQGMVMLRVHVRADGSPEIVELKDSSGSERLDKAALDAVRQWRFVPAKRGSEVIAAWVVVPVSFSLGV